MEGERGRERKGERGWEGRRGRERGNEAGKGEEAIERERDGGE